MNSKAPDPRYDQLSRLLFAAVRDASRSSRATQCPIKQTLLDSIGECEQHDAPIAIDYPPSRPPTGEFELVEETEAAAEQQLAEGHTRELLGV